MKVTFNDADVTANSIEELGRVLDQFNEVPQFELWIVAPSGQSICMLRNGAHAWLLYLRYSDDAGSMTKGNAEAQGMCEYTLANGQVDEYPISWSIDLDECCKALAYFFVNGGERYDFLEWQIA